MPVPELQPPMRDGIKTGVVTCCWKGDEQYVKATCASVRHFCPEVPLCIIVDGGITIDHWAKIYHAQTLYVRRLKNEELRGVMLNSMFAKHAALFEGPFDRFIYLDSDAVFWGDPFRSTCLDHHDFTIFGGSGRVNPAMIEKWQFSLDRMRQFDPAFQLMEHPYFSAGVYGARRGCLPLDRFVALAREARNNGDFFKFGDQGMFNYLVFSEFERRRLSYQSVDLQFFPGHFPKPEMTARFMQSAFQTPPKSTTENLVLHFSGKKPVPCCGGPNHKTTFTCFRLLHGRFAGMPLWRATANLILEDLKLVIRKAAGKARRIIRAPAGN
jgi:hypothetical protein